MRIREELDSIESRVSSALSDVKNVLEELNELESNSSLLNFSGITSILESAVTELEAAADELY